MSPCYDAARLLLWVVPMRALALLVLVAACQSAYEPARFDGSGSGSGSGGGGGGGAGIGGECRSDGDCVLEAATCCDCPSYAVAATSPGANACAAVACPPMSCPAPVQATCRQGACTIACVATACDLSCADGFALDQATGCLACACAMPPAQPACTTDSDCVRVRADCCGCAGGGTDTAVPASMAQSFDASLMCPAHPQCTGTDTCAPDLAPRCLQGQCELVGAMPPGACGRPDLPACPAGQRCTIDANADATAQGVGVCM